MNKFWTVLFHTYISKCRSKSFIITTVVMAILLIGVTNLQGIINLFNSDEPDSVAVLDETGEWYEPLAIHVKHMTDDIDLIHYTKAEEQAKQDVQSGKMTGYLLLTKNDAGLPQATYKAREVSEQEVIGVLEEALQQVKVVAATEQLGIDAEQVESIYSPVSFDTVALDKGAKTAEDLNHARTLVYILVILIFFSVMMYGSMIAMEVATEKSSRVMEILISSVSPVKQMFGKIFGIALLGLTQLVVLFVVGFLSLRTVTTPNVPSDAAFSFLSLEAISPSMIVYATLFFILGYLLYATLFAMLGSLVTRVEETQQIIMPVTFLMLAGFYIAIFGLAAPNTTFITATSFIPFFTPMIMFLRIGLVDVPFWQVALSVATLIVTIVVFVLIGTRVYRGGVLMYGKSSSWKNIKQAFVLTKEDQ